MNRNLFNYTSENGILTTYQRQLANNREHFFLQFFWIRKRRPPGYSEVGQ